MISKDKREEISKETVTNHDNETETDLQLRKARNAQPNINNESSLNINYEQKFNSPRNQCSCNRARELGSICASSVATTHDGRETDLGEVEMKRKKIENTEGNLCARKQNRIMLNSCGYNQVNKENEISLRKRKMESTLEENGPLVKQNRMSSNNDCTNRVEAENKDITLNTSSSREGENFQISNFAESNGQNSKNGLISNNTSITLNDNVVEGNDITPYLTQQDVTNNVELSDNTNPQSATINTAVNVSIDDFHDAEFILVLRVHSNSPPRQTRTSPRTRNRSRSSRRRSRRSQSGGSRPHRNRNRRRQSVQETTTALAVDEVIENVDATEVPVGTGEFEAEDIEYMALSPEDIKRTATKTWRAVPKYRLTSTESNQQEADLYYAFVHEGNHEGVQPANDQDRQCCVCYENVATRIIIPCGHQCLCYPCAKSIALSRSTLSNIPVYKKCPICQAAIANMIRPI